MSSFSVSSSTYSSASYASTSYSSASPATPSSSTAHLPSSPSQVDLTTPLASPAPAHAPEGYRKYSLALVQSMTKGLQSAQKSASASKTGAGARPVFRDDVFLDEDPFDLIVHTQAQRYRGPRPDMALAMAPRDKAYTQSLYVGMDDKTDLLDSTGAPMLGLGGHKRRASDDPPIGRPQLLRFYPSSSSRQSGSASGSGHSVPRAATLAQAGRNDSFLSEGFSTPGSQWSESSFEAMTSADYTTLYGKPLPGAVPQGSTIRREISLDSPFSAPRPSARSSSFQHAHPQPRVEYDHFSDAPSSAQHMDEEMDDEAELAALSQASQRMSIDDTSPADEDEMGRVEEAIGSGSGAVSHRHPFERHAKRPGLLHPRPRGSNDLLDTDDEWLEGRTVSEMMVTQAGRSVQRSRAGATRTSVRS